MSTAENDSSSADVVELEAGSVKTTTEVPLSKPKSALKQYLILGVVGLLSFGFGIAAVVLFASPT